MKLVPRQLDGVKKHDCQAQKIYFGHFENSGFSFFKLTVFAYRDPNATFFSGAHFLDSLVINGSST